MPASRLIIRRQKKFRNNFYDHKGASFVEIFQNCIVYNDNVFSDFTEKDVSADHQIHVEHGKPLTFGKESDKGLRVKPGTFELEAVNLASNGVNDSDILIYDETNLGLAMMLAHMEPPTMPVPIGVLYCHPEPSYEQRVNEQIAQVKMETPPGSLNELLRRGYTWTVS